MRIFLDANILFSAAQDGSPIRQMLEALGKHAMLLTSPYAITEAERNIAAKRPAWMPGLLKLLGAITRESGMSECGDVALDAADRPILGAAIAGRCTHLLTGDFAHFGTLMGTTIVSVKIVSVRLLALEMVQKGWVRPGR